jgi:hypothetical protein
MIPPCTFVHRLPMFPINFQMNFKPSLTQCKIIALQPNNNNNRNHDTTNTTATTAAAATTTTKVLLIP